TAGPVEFRDGSVERIDVELRGSKSIPTMGSAEPWFTGLESSINVTASKLESAKYVVDSLTGSVSSTDGLLRVDQLNLERKENRVAMRAEYRLPESLRQISRTGTLEFSISASELSDFWVSDVPDKWTGPLEGAGRLKWKDGIGNGDLWVA